MRVGLERGDPTRRLHVFVHELTHAFELQESDRRLNDNRRSTHFFSEGCAEYYGFQLIDTPKWLERSRQLAIAAWQIHNIRFGELADGDRLPAANRVAIA